MLFERIVSEGLAHHSYLVAEGGEAAVIDPRRDVGAYLDLAHRHGLRIKAILETHRNEDYAIGSTALAAATGAPVLHSRRMKFGYGQPVGEGDKLGIGRLEVRVLETPGHTDESLTFAVADRRSGDGAVLAFTGDALFVQEVGRTDLYGPEQTERMAAALYQSLTRKILPLGDGAILCPAHGGGSVCGGKILDRDLSTLGYERGCNPRLRLDAAAFVALKAKEKLLVPPYFRRMEEWNQRGTAPIRERLPVPPPLTPEEVASEMERGASVIDARWPQAFAGAHIPGSYSLWFEGLPSFLGWIAPPESRLLFVLPEGRTAEDLARVLLRIGYEGNAVGFLRGGFESWQNAARPVARGATITTEELRQRRDAVVLDVRRPDEVEEGTLAGAKHIFAGELERRIAEVPREASIVTMCSVGHRGGLAASILERHGFPRVLNYLGGFTAWKCAGLPSAS